MLVNDLLSNFEDSTKEFIRQFSPYNPENLVSKLFTNFNRITLVSKQLNERVTIDTELQFYLKEDTIYTLNKCSIIELKRDGASVNSKLSEVLSYFGVHPTGMSKYCLGRAFVEEHLKKNNFKRKIRTLNKIENGEFYYRNLK
jgi:hypothetical protein